MLDLVEVVLHDILVYMVQNNLVGKDHHHLMIDELVYSKVLFVDFGMAVYCFYSVDKMGKCLVIHM